MNSFLMGDLCGCFVSAFGAAAASHGCLAGSTEILLKLIEFYYVSARNYQAAKKTSGQILPEEGDRPLPRQLCRRLVVARRRVVVKAVLRPRVPVHLVRDAGRSQRGLEGRPHRVDSLEIGRAHV